MDRFMRAAVAKAPESHFEVKTYPVPTPGPGEVLVRIAASGVNPLDTKIHAAAAPHARQPLPAVLGLDLAGTLEAVGEGVTRFGASDAVYGMTGGVGGIQGTLAKFASVDADLLAPKPVNLLMREAAALPLVAITAWEGLVDRMAVSDGRTVLIQGGAGGVGHIASALGWARARLHRCRSRGRAIQVYLRWRRCCRVSAAVIMARSWSVSQHWPNPERSSRSCSLKFLHLQLSMLPIPP